MPSRAGASTCAKDLPFLPMLVVRAGHGEHKPLEPTTKAGRSQDFGPAPYAVPTWGVRLTALRGDPSERLDRATRGHVLLAARLNDGETVEEPFKVAGVVARHR
jgi:hypothetical protein